MIEPTPRPTYEEMRGYLRNWNNPNDEIGQYDANGLVHLVLAALDNLRENEDWADLPELRDSKTNEQAAFFMRLAGYVRGSRHQNVATCWPTFGELCDYLTRLGYTSELNDRGAIIFDDPKSDSSFIYRNRDRSALARPSELVGLRMQLLWREIVTAREFAEFWHEGLQAPPLEAFL